MVDIRCSFSDIEWPFSAAAFFIHALPCAAMASELYVSLRLNILLIIHAFLICQEYYDNCFWDCLRLSELFCCMSVVDCCF